MKDGTLEPIRVTEKQSWYQGWDISEAEREVYRQRSQRSSRAKAIALRGEGPPPIHPINTPLLEPVDLMPQCKPNGLRSLSLFSGCGGLDLGFERAGFQHVASYDVLPVAGETLNEARPDWIVFSGEAGDVRKVDWKEYRGMVDVIHGGPPCQPFSIAGRQKGESDERDMFPEFVRAVLDIKPLAFIAENVGAVSSKKFADYVKRVIQAPLSKDYSLVKIELSAPDFGVPQIRKRVFFVGFLDKHLSDSYNAPKPTHYCNHLLLKKKVKGSSSQQLGLFTEESLPNRSLKRCMGIREALGLPDIGFDTLTPTLRSGFTGPRHTTSILNSTSAQKVWERLQIWPNGVALTREKAHKFVPENKHFRLSVPDCALIQGFPSDWPICGPVYKALGQIGNSVAPPMAYHVALSVSRVLTS